MMKKCQLNGMTFYYKDDDRYVGQRAALGKYEPYETKVMLDQVKPGYIVVDIGANIGYYTLLLAQKVGKSGKVYAFEPEKNNFEILKRNVDENMLNNVVLFEAGVGEKEEEKELIISEENYGDHRLSRGITNNQFPITKQTSNSNLQKEQKRQTIKIIRLDKAVKEKVDLIKIDTQGYEPWVIKGAKRLIENDRPEIFLEYTPGEGVKEMMEYLSAYYKNTRIIDDYLFSYYRAILPIDNYCHNIKGYTDVWLSNRNNLKIMMEQYRNLRLKKLIRQILKLKQTG